MPTRTEVVIGWLAMLGVAVVLLACVASLVWWQRWRARPSAGAHRAALAEARRHAATVAARTAQADRALAQARARVREVEQEQAAAWRELEHSRHAHDEAARTHRAAARQRAGRLADPGSGQDLTHAAFAAYRRGDLSPEQLVSVSQLATGWDPELHRQERELTRLRVRLRDALLRYRTAASRGRAAREQRDIAEVEVRALAEEAAEAGQEADVAP